MIIECDRDVIKNNIYTHPRVGIEPNKNKKTHGIKFKCLFAEF